MDGAMKATSDPLPHIPTCKIRGRLIPAYDFLPRLRKLCCSLGFNNPIVTRSGGAAGDLADRLALGYRSSPDDVYGEQDHLILLSAMIPYEQNWGAYTGLPGQHYLKDSGTETPATPADFIVPYVRQYQFAQEHIRLGCDSTGKPVMTVPDAMVTGKSGTAGIGMRMNFAGVAESGETRQPPTASSSLVTFFLATEFRDALDRKGFSWKPGVFSPIGELLVPELFTFTGQTRQNNPPAFPEVLAMMPWIVAHKTPHIAATLVHLQSGFAGACETFAGTGPDDLRNLICVAGLEIDMKGFRGRRERYFVPWQACWKRHGYCYGDIYPLLQDDLFVALMNFNRMGSGAEYTGTERP